MDKIIYSTTNDPTKWANEDYEVIEFATPEDAKKCERMVNALMEEMEKLSFAAAEPHYIQKIKEVMGPLSLWSENGLEMLVQKRVLEHQNRKNK